MLSPLTNLSWKDVVDVLFLSVVTYYFYLAFEGTRALRALVGLIVLGAVYSLAQFWDLFLTTWVFQVLWQVLIILLIILFQNEIRQVLERVNPVQSLLHRIRPRNEEALHSIAKMAREASARDWGALVVIRGVDPLRGLSDPGQVIDAKISSDLLLSIFNPRSPAHDGAVTVSGDRLTAMRVVLPLSKRPDLPAPYGTRHRAALGISEAGDAVVVVVSEERGEISLAVNGELRVINKPENLEQILAELLSPQTAPSRVKLGLSLIRDLVLGNWAVKVASLLLVSLVWLTMAGQQNYEIDLEAPVTYISIPAGLKIGDLSDKTVRVSVSGSRRQASAVRSEDLAVVISLSGLAKGAHYIPLIRQNIHIPLGLEVTSVTPKQLAVTLTPKPIDE